MAANVSMNSIGSTESVKSARLEAVMMLFHSLASRFVEEMRFTLLSQSDVFVHKDFSGSTVHARHVLQDLTITPHIRCVYRFAQAIKFTTLCLKNANAETDSFLSMASVKVAQQTVTLVHLWEDAWNIAQV
jgi:hypothetical protein